MKRTHKAAAALVAAAALGLSSASAASAAGGNGNSVCSSNSSEFAVGTFVSTFAQAGAFSSEGNPGRPYPIVPIGSEGNLGCNPVKTQN